MKLHWLMFLLPLVGVTPGSAQPERGRAEGRVILFENANYRGGAIVLYPGQVIDNLAGVKFGNEARANDRISSIRVEGDVVLLAYEHAGFAGDSLRVTGDVSNLANRPTLDPRVSWNDRISSLRVEGRRGAAGRDATPGAVVDPDAIIKRVYNELLGRDPDDFGYRNYRQLILDQGWNERMVRDNIQRSPEFRLKAADIIIQRAYRDLLGREPDDAGRFHFRKMIIDRGWSEQEVRDNIRRGEEYRNRPR